MEKLRNSGFLKVLCYILIPIFVFIWGFSIFHIAYLNEHSDENETNYIKTSNFTNNYLYFVINKVQECANNIQANSQDFKLIDKKDGNTYYYSNNLSIYNYYNGIGAYINYIIVDKETNEIYSNIKSTDYQKEIEIIKEQEMFWNFVDEKIDTNIQNINQENVIYNNIYRDVIRNGFQYQISSENAISSIQQKELSRYNVYSYYDENKTAQMTNFALNRQVYEYMLQNRKKPIYNLATSTFLLILIAFYLFWSIGHKKGVNGIALNGLDKIPYEIILLVCSWITTIGIAIVLNMGNIVNYIFWSIAGIAYFITYIACAVWGITTIKRLKAKIFLKSFLTYKILRWMYRKIKKMGKEIAYKTSSNQKVWMYFGAYLFINMILIVSFTTGISIFILIAFNIWVLYKIKQYIRQQDELREALKSIYNGKTDIRLDETVLPKVLKEMAIYINDIAGGFSNAIEQNLKAERLKTELITNVSHDIKTPLTSIINYVDLLKKENIEDKKIQEYIQILDQKSMRLKKLTEDLVEASKVSSGNVKLNIEEIQVKELINQAIGEFKDRFEEKKLKIETSIPEEEMKIKADNRYLYRIIENLFSNIIKYAQEGSRVYIDVKKEKNNISMIIKNISKEKLNISAEELMQRFVRGDKSRYTEGSGLGLSIAKSLTELQKGEFEITIDGDLFKVEMIWKNL